MITAMCAWIVVLGLIALASRFFYTALVYPEQASDSDAYHADFRRLKIAYYAGVWTGFGAFVFFAAKGALQAGLAAAAVEPAPVWDNAVTLVAVALGFVSILAINQISVTREFITERNRQNREAETLRHHIKKLLEDLDYADDSEVNDIRTCFLRCRVDLEMSRNGLTPGDRDLVRGVMKLARRGVREMDGVDLPEA